MNKKSQLKRSGVIRKMSPHVMRKRMEKNTEFQKMLKRPFRKPVYEPVAVRQITESELDFLKKRILFYTGVICTSPDIETVLVVMDDNDCTDQCRQDLKERRMKISRFYE